MLRIIISGCNGKMGGAVIGLAAQKQFEVVAGIDKNTGVQRPFPVFADADLCNIAADAVIDFSHPDALTEVLNYCVSKQLPVVIGTTGLSPLHQSAMKEASAMIPLFYAANMSWGIHVLNRLVRQATLELHNDFDIEITERHHNLKKDAPSGTAMTLLKTVIGATPEAYPVFDRHLQKNKREKNEIGIHSVRGGAIVGDHEVLFAGLNEIIEIRHSAQSRDIFASGALRAAAFLARQKAGFYGMEDLIKNNG